MSQKQELLLKENDIEFLGPEERKHTGRSLSVSAESCRKIDSATAFESLQKIDMRCILTHMSLPDLL